MMHLYGMNAKLVNVRLDEERLRKAKALRDSGIAISDLVREAIDQRYELLVRRKRRNVKTIMKGLFDQYPDPPNLPPRDYDVHDRRQARKAIVRKLKRKRR
jgi:hypothetical protein